MKTIALKGWRSKFPERNVFSIIVSPFSDFKIWCDMPAVRVIACSSQTKLVTDMVSMYLSKDIGGPKKSRLFGRKPGRVPVYYESIDNSIEKKRPKTFAVRVRGMTEICLQNEIQHPILEF